MVLTSTHAIDVLQRYLLSNDDHLFKRLYLDATGKITSPVNDKPMLYQVLLAAIPKIGSETCLGKLSFEFYQNEFKLSFLNKDFSLFTKLSQSSSTFL